jgi:hypothetical protein
MKNGIAHIAAIACAVLALSACGSANGVVPQTASQSAQNTGATSSSPGTTNGQLNTAGVKHIGRSPCSNYAEYGVKCHGN